MRVHSQSPDPRLKAAGLLRVGDLWLRLGTTRVQDAVCRLAGAAQAVAGHRVVTTTTVMVSVTFAGRPQRTPGARGMFGGARRARAAGGAAGASA